MEQGIHITKKIVTIIAAALYSIGQSITYAQNEGTPPIGAVTITSNPPGALVYLTGEYHFIGRTPFVLPYSLFGKYRVHANRLGYETVTSQYNFTGESGLSRLMIKLSPKTRFKAFYRSLLFPGWGQYYSGRKFAGTILMGGTAGAFVALAIYEHQYKDSQTDYKTALVKFNRAGGSFDEQRDAFNDLQSALQALEDSKDARNTSFYIAGGLWLLNMIESIIFFPNHAQDIEIFQKLSPKVSHEGKEIKLTMQIPID